MVEDLKDREHVLLDMIVMMGEAVPWVVESIIFERDLYMMNELVRTMDSIEGDEPQVYFPAYSVCGSVYL